MSRPPGSPLALALVLSALGVAACGSDDEGTIPQDDAATMLGTLSEIEEKVADGDCTGAQTDATQLSGQIFDLPKEVGITTKEDLRDATTRLIELINDPAQCEGDEEQPTPSPDTGATGAFGFEEDG